MRTRPESGANREIAMKSTRHGIAAARTRSARNTTPPRNTDTRMGSTP